METEIAAILTPEQKVKYEQFLQRQHELWRQMQEQRGMRGGRDRPPGPRRRRANRRAPPTAGSGADRHVAPGPDPGIAGLRLARPAGFLRGMEEPLAGRKIILGVTGSIAAYKAADLVSRLGKLGRRCIR